MGNLERTGLDRFPSSKREGEEEALRKPPLNFLDEGSGCAMASRFTALVYQAIVDIGFRSIYPVAA